MHPEAITNYYTIYCDPAINCFEFRFNWKYFFLNSVLTTAFNKQITDLELHLTKLEQTP